MSDDIQSKEQLTAHTSNERAVYSPPTLEVFGRVSELTAGGTAPPPEAMIGGVLSRRRP